MVRFLVKQAILAVIIFLVFIGILIAVVYYGLINSYVRDQVSSLVDQRTNQELVFKKGMDLTLLPDIKVLFEAIEFTDKDTGVVKKYENVQVTFDWWNYIFGELKGQVFLMHEGKPLVLSVKAPTQKKVLDERTRKTAITMRLGDRFQNLEAMARVGIEGLHFDNVKLEGEFQGTGKLEFDTIGKGAFKGNLDLEEANIDRVFALVDDIKKIIPDIKLSKISPDEVELWDVESGVKTVTVDDLSAQNAIEGTDADVFSFSGDEEASEQVVEQVPLHILDALWRYYTNISITAKKVTLHGWHWQDVSLNYASGRAEALIALQNASFMEGKLKGDVRIFKDNDSYGLEVSGEGNKVALGKIIQKMSQITTLEGKGNLTFNVNSQGNAIEEWRENLSGEGAFDLADGKLRGMDLTLLSDPKNILTAFSQAENVTTDIAKANASFTIEKGELNNDDLEVVIPFNSLTGKGRINIVDYRTKYVLTPKIYTKGKKDGDKFDSVGLSVPLIIEGDIRKPSYKLDIRKAVINNLANDKLMENKEVQKALGNVGKHLSKEQIDKFGGMLFKDGVPDNVMEALGHGNDAAAVEPENAPVVDAHPRDEAPKKESKADKLLKKFGPLLFNK